MTWEEIRRKHVDSGPQDKDTWLAIKDAIEFLNWMSGIPINGQEDLMQVLLKRARDKMEKINGL